MRPFIVTPRPTVLPGLIVAWALVLGVVNAALAQSAAPGDEQLAEIAGEVTLTAADGTTFPAGGVRLSLKCTSDPLPRLETSDQTGAFRFAGVPAIGCRLSTDLQGFRSETAEIDTASAADLRFRLEVDPVFAAVTVTGGPAAHIRAACRALREAARRR